MKQLVLFCIICNVQAIFAQESVGFVKGRVISKSDNEPVIGAQVRAWQGQVELAATVSDLDGFFNFALPSGLYKISCTFVGLVPDTVIVEVKTDSITNLAFLLKESDKVLNQVVVSAGKFEQKIEDLTVSMEIIRPELIENRNTTSIEQALEQTPGLTIMDNEPQIRGGSGFTFGVGSRVAIVVDGMPMTTGDAGRPEWGFIPVENVEQIEVIKGASSVLYGSSALSGVIHIRSAYPRAEPVTKINFTSGVYSPPKNAANWRNEVLPIYTGVNFLHSQIVKKRLDMTIGGNFFRDAGYIGPPGLENDTLIIDSLTPFKERELIKTRARLNFNLRYRFEKIKGLDVGINGNGMYSNTNFALAWLDDSTNIYRAYPGSISLQNQRIFHIDPFANYFAKNGVRHSLRLRAFAADNQITNNQSNSSVLLYGEYQVQRQFQKIPDLNFTGGIVGMRTSSNAQLYAGAGDTRNFIVNAAGYAQIDKKFWDILNISSGVRFEYFKMNDRESVVKPIFRTGASLKLTEGTIVRASYGQGFRFPTIAERFILTNVGSFGVFPNPDLEPETSENYELAIKQGFKIGNIGGYFDIAGFYQDFQNTIEYLFGVWDWSVAPVGFKFLNTGHTRVKGLDASLTVGAIKKKDFQLTVLAGYTYVLPQSMEPDYVYAVDNAPAGPRPLSFNTTSMDSTNRILKYRYQHSGKADLDFKYKGFSWGYSTRFYSAMKNIDNAFDLLEQFTQGVPFIANFYGLNYWEKSRSGFFWIHDTRLGYVFDFSPTPSTGQEKAATLSNRLHKSQLRVALVINNLLNTEYALRPVKIESPRTTALQIVYKF